MFSNNILTTIFVLLTTLALLFVSCDSNSSTDPDPDPETGTLEVMLHDAPANYEQVNVFIETVEVNKGQTDEGWIEISTPQQSFDLLTLTNGATEALGSAELEVGTYQQIRLMLSSEGHSVVIDGTEHDMFVPSGDETGIKLNIDADIQSNMTYTLLLDFDAARSIVERGDTSGTGVEYLLKPVIRAYTEAETGNIAGTVEPVDAYAFIYAIAGSDTLSSTKADTTDGTFNLMGLGEGSYTISVDPTNEAYQISDTTGVAVTIGETNDIGTITLSSTPN